MSRRLMIRRSLPTMIFSRKLESPQAYLALFSEW